ncbi:MAG: hypothetical protein M3Q42_11805 [Pseudomonadota bacterium]|nr:hypothetical protein [Pseudomonadota bacterium]
MPLPTVRATIAAPEPLLQERSFLRLHNRAAKDALREEGEKHHKQRMPGHFQRSAAGKYGHMRRKEKYIRFKARRWRSVTDLVKTGATKMAMLQSQPTIRVGGKAADDDGKSGSLRLTLTMPFPPGAGAQQAYAQASPYARKQMKQRAAKEQAAASRVTIQQMRKELATIIDPEARDIAKGFIQRYGRHLARALAKSPRIRKRVAAAKASS